MAFKEKTYILKHSPDGLKLFRDREADQPDIEFGAEAPPDKDILVPPPLGSLVSAQTRTALAGHFAWHEF